MLSSLYLTDENGHKLAFLRQWCTLYFNEDESSVIHYTASDPMGELIRSIPTDPSSGTATIEPMVTSISSSAILTVRIP